LLRRLLKLTAGVLLTLAILVPSTTAGAATTTDFAGVWTSVDAVDGSDQVMVITRGLTIVLFDTSATVCDGAPAIVTGRGTISGDDLNVTLRAVCLGGGGVTVAEATFTYDADSDTLTDNLGGTVWS
jgi:hypothetical protein